MIMPSMLSNTAIIEGRIDLRTVASLYRFFTQQGILCSTKSAVVKEVFEALLTILVENNMCERVTDLQEAISIMQPLSTGHDKRVERNLYKEITVQKVNSNDMKKEAMRILNENREFFDSMAKKYVSDSNNGAVKLSPEAQYMPNLSDVPSAVDNEDN